MFNVHRTPNRMNPNQQPKTARSEPTPIRRPPPLQTSALPASRRSPPAPLPPSGLPPSATVTARPPVRGRPDRARARAVSWRIVNSEENIDIRRAAALVIANASSDSGNLAGRSQWTGGRCEVTGGGVGRFGVVSSVFVGRE